jgi:molybdopterin-binding protein
LSGFWAPDARNGVPVGQLKAENTQLKTHAGVYRPKGSFHDDHPQYQPISLAIQLLCRAPFETIRPTMQISARNILKGKVAKLVEGAVNCEVTLEIAPGVEIVSIITKASAASLGLAEGQIASAVIKASSVMIAVD